MSDASDLRKRMRQKKLLDHLQSMSRNSLANHTLELACLDQQLADLDTDGQSSVAMKFLDLRLSFQTLLMPQRAALSDAIEAEAGKSAVLKRRVDAANEAIVSLRAKIQQAADIGEAEPSYGSGRCSRSQVLRKPKP
jgi:hypothetical protein